MIEGKKEISENTKHRIIIFCLILLCMLIAYLAFSAGKYNLKLKSELEQRTRELNQVKTELATSTDYWKVTLGEVKNRKSDIRSCVEPGIPLIRDVAVAEVANPPTGIKSNSESWKIWQINYWAAHNIQYINDPKGIDYYALASETMLTRAGDCDDYAILISSMYESIGLDACIALVDTDNNTIADHMSCLVYYSNNPDSFRNEEKAIMDSLFAKSPTGQAEVSYFETDKIKTIQKYKSGIWVIIDPLDGFVRDMPGYINYENYHVMQVVDVGN